MHFIYENNDKWPAVELYSSVQYFNQKYTTLILHIDLFLNAEVSPNLFLVTFTYFPSQ